MFAYAASRALDSLNISHTIIVQCHDNYDLITFQEKYGSIGKSINKVYQKYLSDVNENNSLANIYGIHCHIVIRVNGVDYDAEGIAKDRYISDHIINIKTLKQAVKSPIWNSTFKNYNQGCSVMSIADKAESLSNKILKNNSK